MDKITCVPSVVFVSGTRIKTVDKKPVQITIDNFHRVDGTLLRGAKPTQAGCYEIS